MGMMNYYLLLLPMAALALAVWALEKKVQSLEKRLDDLAAEIYLGPDHGKNDLH